MVEPPFARSERFPRQYSTTDSGLPTPHSVYDDQTTAVYLKKKNGKGRDRRLLGEPDERLTCETLYKRRNRREVGNYKLGNTNVISRMFAENKKTTYPTDFFYLCRGNQVSHP